MNGEFSEKITVKYPPCKQPQQSCIEYDYDPCESSDDITEKDLGILLKEEDRLRVEIEGETEEEIKAENAESYRKEAELLKEKKNGAESVKPLKKCKKVNKNPFYSNRLELSPCLPLRPPVPPPQFFPASEEDEKKVCVKKRKKKCKVKKEEEITESPEGKSNRAYGADGTRGPGGICEVYGPDGTCGIYGPDGTCGAYGADEICEGSEADGRGGKVESKRKQDEQSEEEPRQHRRKCRKINKSPCRKRSSEISNFAFQPRQIPAPMKDPPRTSPLESPEVERQIWLSSKNDAETDCMKNNCKKACLKKKCERKRQSSEDPSSE